MRQNHGAGCTMKTHAPKARVVVTELARPREYDHGVTERWRTRHASKGGHCAKPMECAVPGGPAPNAPDQGTSWGGADPFAPKLHVEAALNHQSQSMLAQPRPADRERRIPTLLAAVVRRTEGRITWAPDQGTHRARHLSPGAGSRCRGSYASRACASLHVAWLTGQHREGRRTSYSEFHQ